MNAKKLALGAFVLAAAVSNTAKADSWADKVTLGGDFTFREQYLQYDGQPNNTAAKTYNPQRAYYNNAARLRLDIGAKVNDMVKVYSQIGTNTSGRTSNITLGDTTGGSTTTPNKFPIGMNLAYALITPAESTKIMLGKAINPFYKTMDNEMIWDNDLTFEGASVKYNMDAGSLKPFLNLTGTWLQKATTVSATGSTDASPADTMLFGAQVGTTVKLGDTMDMTLAIADYNFSALSNKPTFFGLSGLNSGNTLKTVNINSVATSVYANDFNLLDIAADLTMDVGMPLTLSYDYVMNTQISDPSLNFGYNVGIKLGKLKDIGSYYVAAQYRAVKSDAVVSALTDSDYAQGVGSNLRGYKLSAAYQWMENTSIVANYWGTQYNVDAVNVSTLNPNGGTGNYQNRIDLDLNVKF
jgi:hypothetical protein